MKSRKLSFVVVITLLLITISCSVVGSQTQSKEPASAIYATAITTGGTHACALSNNGKVKCWGANSSGQLGDGTYTKHNTPTEVPGLENVIALSAGGEYTCALLATGEAKCWGDNIYGQLGDGTKIKKAVPTLVSGLTDAVFISAGAEHTCAITKDHRAMCWGKNLYGRIGNGSNDRIISTPVNVAGLTEDVISISAGYEHTCLVLSSGKVQCWGHNNGGQVGDGTTINRKSPTDVDTQNNPAKFISTGFSTSCALTAASDVWCWGWVGLQDYYTSPIRIDGLDKDIAEVTVGGDHICGRTTNGKVKCLGENDHGQLGNSSTNPVYSAASVKGLEDVTAIAANMDYTCALTGGGQVFCWGQNSSGQLGNGSYTNSLKPVEVAGLNE